MNANNPTQARRRLLLAVLTLALTLIVIVPLVVAQPAPAPAAPGAPGASSPAALDPAGALGADDGVLDVGAEHQADGPPYGSSAGDLPICQTSANNFYWRMRNIGGYTGSNSFLYANSLAWETDWKRSALGGSEEIYADNVDIAYYCDHGSNGAVYFPWGHTDNWLVPNDCYGSWGTRDNEWMAFGTCLTLTDRGGWANCMNGQHLIAGYITVSYDSDEGGEWANRLLAGNTVTQAWFGMCDATQPSSVVARVIAEDWRHFSDRVWNRGGPAYGDIVDSWYYWQDHSCYKAPPKIIDPDSITAMPAYVVQDRAVNTDFVQNIAGALGLEGQATLDNGVYTLVDTTGGMTHTLTVDAASGGYQYQNNSTLWVAPDPSEPAALPDPAEAMHLADNFFLANAQALPGASYLANGSAFTEQVTQAERGGGFLGADRIVQEQGVDVMVAYGRNLTVGLAQGGTTEVSVAGPGAGTKYYIAQAATAQDALAGGPAGVVGGSRDVSMGASIAVQDSDKAWEAFEADHQLAIVTIPLDADHFERHPISDTLAYYEQPHGISQQELIPVWVFNADLFKGQDLLVANALIYVPASPDYYPPTGQIISPDNGANAVAGQQITFKAQATGGFGPFTYDWSSSVDGPLGTGAEIMAALSGAAHPEQDGPTPHSISVKITNANGQSRTLTVGVNVGRPIYMPMHLFAH